MVSESVAIANSITPKPVYASWVIVETACAGQLVTKLCGFWDRVVLRRRTTKDTSERWFRGGNPRSETTLRPGVRNSVAVEERSVEDVPVASPAFGPPGPSKIRSSSSQRRRKISPGPMKLRRKIEISSPPTSPQKLTLVEDLSFPSTVASQVSRGKSRRSGRDQRAAPVFQNVFP